MLCLWTSCRAGRQKNLRPRLDIVHAKPANEQRKQEEEEKHPEGGGRLKPEAKSRVSQGLQLFKKLVLF